MLLLAFGVQNSSGNVYSDKSADDLIQIDCDDKESVYIVQAGDKLYEIGNYFGSALFWEAIYIANADLIDDPDLIYTGQQFEIPHNIANYRNSGLPLDMVLSSPFCSLSELPLTSVVRERIFLYDIAELAEQADAEREDRIAEQVTREEAEADESDAPELTAFREAFESVVETEQRAEPGDEQEQRESERRLLLEIDGMIHDETRSKIGRDFYDVFYSNWQSPPDAYNFTINISEQPSPSLGTIIYVEVNENETFRMRLQPRYDFIQQAGQHAVRLTYNYLQNNDHEMQIY